MKARIVPFVLALLTLPAATAQAQDRGQIGIVAGFPSTVGFLWHASDSIAVRPELDFTFASTETEGGLVSSERSSRLWSVGTSVLFYNKARDNVRTYLSPRLMFVGNSGDPDESATSTSGWSAAGSFGIQYTPVRRFGLFGELGLEYTRSKTEIEFELPVNLPIDLPIVLPGEFSTTTSGFGIRTAVGVIIYFGR